MAWSNIFQLNRAVSTQCNPHAPREVSCDADGCRYEVQAFVTRSVTATLGCLLMFACCGCTVVESDHPLSDAKTHVVDDRLVGEWKSVDPKADPADASEQQRVVVRKAGDQRYEAVSPDQDKPVPFFATKLNDRSYASFENVDDADSPGGYLLFEYKLLQGELHLYLLHPEQTATAVQHGKIDGSVRHADMQPDDDPNEPREIREIRLTASTERLRALFATPEGQALFHTAEPVLIFRRATK